MRRDQDKIQKLVVLSAAILLFGCNDPKLSIELKGQPAVPAPPRYQIIINTQEFTGANAEAFLLDTQRGRVWGYNRFVPPETMENFYPITIIDDEGVIGMTSNDWHSFQAFKKAKRDAKETQVILDRAAKEAAAAEVGKKDSAKHE